MSVTITGFTDNTEEVLQGMRAAVARGLERCGEKAEGYAVDLCPVDTGNLRSSITHTVNDDTVYIGTNVEYGLYQEVGTGKYATGGGGRPTPWAYQDVYGHWHWTAGNRANPFVKPAMADHAGTYRNIMNDALKNG